MGLLSRLFGGDRTPRELVTDLVDNYQAEVAQAACLRSHADQARYPHVATQLRALAVIEDRHAGLLRDHILGLGGGIPPVAPAPVGGCNQWERAVAARKAAQEKRRRLIEHVGHWDPDEPAASKLLARIYDEDGETLAAYDDVVARSDPHALD